VPFLIFILAAYVYSQFGFRGLISRDGGIILYAGQQMAASVPPYVSILDNAPPLPFLLAGLGATLSHSLGWDDVLTIRLLYFVTACFAVVAVYLLGSMLFRSRRVGFLGALVFLGFIAYTREAASGPNAKTPMVLFIALSLLLTTERKWFWAGICGSLAFLTWQMAAIFPLATLILAAARPRAVRVSSIVRALVGVAIPLATVSAYFTAYGAVYEMLDGAFLFNLRDIDRGGGGFPISFYFPVRAIHDGYGTMLVPILIGLVMVIYIYFWRKALHPSWREALISDEFAPLLLTFPAFFVWSLFDYQGPPDFFVFLPYVALGFGQLLDMVIQRIEEVVDKAKLPQSTPRFVTAGLFIALFASTMTTIYATPRSGLDDQLQGAVQIEEQYGEEVELLSIGAPELLALLHRTSPTRYVFVTTGVDQHIEANVAGGFEGWLRELAGYNPDVIALGRTRGEYSEQLMSWIRAGYEEEQIGPWTLYARKPTSQ
jgi:hypothetical protein